MSTMTEIASPSSYTGKPAETTVPQIKYTSQSGRHLLESPENEVTELLRQVTEGSGEAREQLFQRVFPQLLEMASARIRRERPGDSLMSRDLVNEAFIRLANQRTPQKNSAQLFGIFALLMRWILVDRAKRKAAGIRGGGQRAVTLGSKLPLPVEEAENVLAIHQALEKLERENSRQSKIVELRFFGGLTNQEIAAELRVSLSTVESDWRFARAWLRLELEGGV